MDHIAVDIGGQKSQICRRSPDGKIVEERRIETRSLPEWFRSVDSSRVVLETCAESFWLADQARGAKHDVRVVAAGLVKTLGVGSRGTKTDQRDARILSEVSCRIELPSVHVTSQQSRDRKTMLSMRDGLVQGRTMLVNTVRGWLRTLGIRCASGSVETFPPRVRKALSAVPPLYIERQLEMIAALSKSIIETDREFAAIAKQDSVCPRLMSVPGIGPVTALAFVAVVDEIGRFDSAHKLEAYLGLTPGEHSSSDKKRRTGITKAGSTRLRWLLVQAAWSIRRAKPNAINLWACEVEKRRGKPVAAVALARKLAGILFALWRDGTLYSPDNAARPLEAKQDLPPLITLTAQPRT